MSFFKKKKNSNINKTFADYLSEFQRECSFSEDSLNYVDTDSVEKYIVKRMSLINDHYLTLGIAFKKNYNIKLDLDEINLKISKIEDEVNSLILKISESYCLGISSKGKSAIREIIKKINEYVRIIFDFFVSNTGNHSIEKFENKIFIVHGQNIE